MEERVGANLSETLSNRDRFNVLHGTLSWLYSALIDFEFKHGSLLAIVLGWLITAENAQKFFAMSLLARISITIAMLSLTILHAFWVRRFYAKSLRAYHTLNELALVPTRYYEDLRIQPSVVVTFCVIHAIFTIFTCVLVWTTDILLRSEFQNV